MKTGFAFAALVAAAALCAPAQAQGPQRTQSGVLDCDVSGGIGFIIASNKGVTCLFKPDQPGRPQEVYVGNIAKLGIDIGGTTGGKMVWAVFEPTSRRGAGLAGSYVGATAEATVAAGLGANVLVGGSDRSVALQPLSITEQTGLNVAAGVADLHLEPAAGRPR
jgi:hypothetical protein